MSDWERRRVQDEVNCRPRKKHLAMKRQVFVVLEIRI